MEKEIKIGTIVTHEFRKSAVYLVIGVAGEELKMVRVKKDKKSGYPFAGYRSTYRCRVSDVEEFDFVENHSYLEKKAAGMELSSSVVFPPVSEENLYLMLKSGAISKIDWINWSSIAGMLSPENLHCDGEISYSQAMAKKSKLDRAWKVLEAKYQISLSEEILWKVFSRILEEEREERSLDSETLKVYGDGMM